MAEIVCKFDTETKSMTVTNDGIPVNNIDYFSVGRVWDSEKGDYSTTKYGLNFSTREENVNGNGIGVSTYTRVTASDNSGDEVMVPSPAKASEPLLNNLFKR